MKDTIEDMVKETIDEKPLGGKSFSSIIKSNSFDKPSKGLESLLSNNIGRPLQETKTQIQQVTTEFYPSDMMINNEFLRIEREKNEELTKTLEELKELPGQLSTIQSKLDELTHFEEMNKLDQDINNEISKNLFDSLKEKRNYLYVVMGICTIFGLLLGNFLTPSREVKPLPKAPVAELKPIQKIKLIQKYVTLKFVNLRDSNSPKSNVVQTIAPNQSLIEIEKKGGWLKVEYRDLIKDTTITGWAWYENLKKLK